MIVVGAVVTVVGMVVVVVGLMLLVVGVVLVVCAVLFVASVVLFVVPPLSASSWIEQADKVKTAMINKMITRFTIRTSYIDDVTMNLVGEGLDPP